MKFKPQVWSLFDEPYSSNKAKVNQVPSNESTSPHLQAVSVTSIMFIAISILSFCLKTQPSFRIPVLRVINCELTKSCGSQIVGLLVDKVCKLKT